MLKSKLRKTGVCLHFCTRSPENACYNSTTFPTLSTLFLRSVPVCPPEALSFLPRFARFYSIYLYRTGRKVHFFRSKIFFVRGAKMHFSTGFTKAAWCLFRRKKANAGERRGSESGRSAAGSFRGRRRRKAARFGGGFRGSFPGGFTSAVHPVFNGFSPRFCTVFFIIIYRRQNAASRPKSARCKTAFRRRAAARKAEFARCGNCCCTAGLPRRGGSTRGRRPRAGKCRIGNARAVARYRRGRAANHVELCPVIFWAQDVVLQRFHVKQSETYAAHFRADNVSCETFLHGEM